MSLYNKIAVGTAQFGLNYGITNSTGKVRLKEAEKIIAFAQQSGITLIDTAVAYGDSQKVLGEIGVDDFQVVSKLPPLPLSISQENVASWVEETVESSLKDLCIKALHAFLLHRPDDLTHTNGEIIYTTLQKLKHQGVIKNIGLSIYQPKQYVDISHLEFDIIQAPFNIFDRRIMHSGMLKLCKEKSIEVHARSLFLQGILLQSSKELSPIFNTWADNFAKWFLWLQNSKLTAKEACLNMPLAIDEICSVVIGFDTLTQFQDILNTRYIEGLSVPDDLASDDPNLINPSMWKEPDNA